MSTNSPTESPSNQPSSTYYSGITIFESTVTPSSQSFTSSTPFSTPQPAIIGLSAATGILFATVLVLSSLLLLAVAKLRKRAVPGHKYQQVEVQPVPVVGPSRSATQALGNPLYGVGGATSPTQNGSSLPVGYFTVQEGGTPSNSLYMTISSAENYQPRTERPQIRQFCSSNAIGTLQRTEVACESSVAPDCEAGEEAVSVGYTRISIASQRCLAVHTGPTGNGNHSGNEPGDLQRSEVAPSSGGKRATEHAIDNTAPHEQCKETSGRQTAAERTGDNTVEHSSQKVPLSSLAVTQEEKDDPEENYATISDIIGSMDEEETEDPYSLVGPSSENASICSGIFAKDQLLVGSSPPDHFQSMYALLGAKSLEDLHEKSQLEMQRMKAKVKTRGASFSGGNVQLELGGSFTLLTDNPCHDEDMDRLSYRGDIHSGCHLDPSSAAVNQRRSSMTLPQITVVPSQGLTATPPLCQVTSQCLPTITIQATTPQQDECVAIAVGNPAPLQGQEVDSLCPNTTSTLPQHLQVEKGKR